MIMVKFGDKYYDVLDTYSGEWITYIETTVSYNGTIITPDNEALYIDNTIYIKLTAPFTGYAKRVLDNGMLNPKWFGAACDGVTNDLAAFTEALRIAGLYRISLGVYSGQQINLNGATVVIPENVTILFNGGFIKNATLSGNRTAIVAGEFKIFDLTVTLGGTFFMPYICPQHFGAVSNLSIDVFENDIAPMMVKCISSPLAEVFIPNGLYYTTAWSVPNSKIIRLAGSVDMSDGSVEQDHARLYTDQDINLITIQSGGVIMSGGLIDVSPVGNYTKKVVSFDLNYNIHGGHFSTPVLGSFADLALNENLVGAAYWFDMSNITAAGYATYVVIDAFIRSMPVGIGSDPIPDFPGLFLNSLTFLSNMDGCKMFYKIDELGGVSRFEGFLQCRNVLTTGEKAALTPAAQINSAESYYNLFPWDNGTRQAGDDPFLFTGFARKIGPLTEKFYANLNDPQDIQFSKINNPIYSILASNKRGYNTVISRLDNEMVALDKRHTVTMKAFKGAGIDFDTDLDENLGATTTDITLARTSNLFRIEGEAPSIIFTPSADLDEDYVEIVLTPSSGSFKWANWFLTVYQGSAFKRIQFIDHYTSSPFTTAYNIYPGGVDTDTAKKTYRLHFSPRSSSKTIIRLIGAYNASSEFLLVDMCAGKENPETVPYIHTDGGQRIWGNITTEQYKLSALNSTPASAGATGTLGDIRVTADYIYICVATNTWKRVAITTW
jgi:hypothetical protein